MYNKNFNGDNGLATLKFKYNDDSYGLWNTWDEMISYWAIFYNNSKAAADSHFRKYAYGCVCDKNGYEIAYSKKTGPLTAKEKAELMAEAVNVYDGKPAEIGVEA